MKKTCKRNPWPNFLFAVVNTVLYIHLIDLFTESSREHRPVNKLKEFSADPVISVFLWTVKGKQKCWWGLKEEEKKADCLKSLMSSNYCVLHKETNTSIDAHIYSQSRIQALDILWGNQKDGWIFTSAETLTKGIAGYWSGTTSRVLTPFFILGCEEKWKNNSLNSYLQAQRNNSEGKMERLFYLR